MTIKANTPNEYRPGTPREQELLDVALRYAAVIAGLGDVIRTVLPMLDGEPRELLGAAARDVQAQLAAVGDVLGQATTTLSKEEQTP